MCVHQQHPKGLRGLIQNPSTVIQPVKMEIVFWRGQISQRTQALGGNLECWNPLESTSAQGG